ncbi:MAG: nucleoside-diphosphate kinase [Dehalococcoidia bacterium]|nr:nucleoside-diphosphate kinase [Dehalococcoidia bacterium]
MTAVEGPSREHTLILVKPDGVQRALVGDLLGRFERRGLKIVGLKMTLVERSLAEEHYDVHRGKFFFADLVEHLTSAPVVAAVLEGPEAIQVVRALVGSTRPWEAAPGTIRGDLALHGLRNLIHASDAPETAAAEISLWFRTEELCAYSREVDRWVLED